MGINRTPQESPFIEPLCSFNSGYLKEKKEGSLGI